MSTTAIFGVITALLAQLPAVVDAAVPGALTWDGLAPSTDAGQNFLCVGVPDPNDPDAWDSATAQQSWAHVNHTARNEDGQLWLTAVAQRGDDDLAAARTTVQTIVGAVEDYLRSNYTLKTDPDDPSDPGVPQLLWTGFGDSITLQQDRTDRDVIAQVSFNVMFKARI